MEYFTDDATNNSGLGPRFDFSSLFNHAFDLYKRSFGWQVLAIIFVMIIGLVTSSVVNTVFGVNQVMLNEQIRRIDGTDMTEVFRTVISAPGQMQSLIASSLLGTLLFPLNAAFPYLMHKANTNQTIGFEDIFIGYRKNFVQLLILGFLITLIMYVSVAMCIIPYFLVIPLWYTATCFVLFENKTAVEALKSSFNLGKVHYGTLLGFSFIAILFAIGGLLLCCIGIVLTVPFFYAAAYSPYVSNRGVPGSL